jgi:hypothetical protein
MVPVSSRVRRRLVADFGPKGEDMARRVERAIDSAPLAQLQDQERLHAAVVLAADGTVEGFEAQLELAQLDWRDVLMNAGLENFDYAVRTDAEFGPA